LIYSKQKYPNAFGQQTYKASWSQEVRLTARLGFLLVDMAPQDIVACRDFCQKFCSVRPNNKMMWGDIVWMLLTGALKWPTAIDALREEARQHLSEEPTADIIVSFLSKAILACDGQPMAKRHSEISVTGRTAAVSGPTWLGRQLGFLQADADGPEPHQAKKRRGDAASSQEARSGQIVMLGRKQRPYRMFASPGNVLKSCEHLIQAAAKFDLQWPASNEPEVVKAFANAVVDITCQGFQITKPDSYSIAGIARKILLFRCEVGMCRGSSVCLTSGMR
jgi:hypothetical protein